MRPATATYLFRMDDIAPGMDWAWFWKYMELFRAHGVRPLLAVVPDNRDPDLECEPRRPEFWEVLRDLRDQGQADIGQHGFQHLLSGDADGLLCRFGFPRRTEFAGLPDDRQREKIAAGRRILSDQSLETDVWVAPAHSFDGGTLRALHDAGFRIVSDGIGLFPYHSHGLVFVPQQVWRPRRFPLGVITCCIHSNHRDTRVFAQVREHLERGASATTIRDAADFRPGPASEVTNVGFRTTYTWARRARNRLRPGAPAESTGTHG
jgi:predicted deacetylase